MAFRGKPIEEAINICESKDWALEFSSGLPHRADMARVYETCNLTRMPHNYFPAPAVPFVLNLASKNEEIRRQSMEHCLLGLRLSAQADAPFYAAHAGFCIDPNPDELGKQLRVNVPYERETHWQLFLESVQEILKTADELDTDFLIENNVVAAMNMYENKNPLFCGDAPEMARLIGDISHPRLGILLDTAHLKVSSNTLNFNLNEAMKILQPHIRGIHHSDNDGQLDTNEKITPEYWFFDYLKNYRELTHVLEVKDLTSGEIERQLNLFKATHVKLDTLTINKL